MSRGSVVAVDVETGKIKWQTYMVPDNGGSLGGYSGGGVWGSTPVIDHKRHSVYVGTGNNFSVPAGVKTCFAANNNSPNCAALHDYFDSVVALDLDTGIVKWANRALYYDAFNINCIFTITSFSPPTYVFGPGQNCPAPTGPDYDFGGAGPNLFSVGNNDILGIGEKSGIYWALNPNNGALVWNTPVGPGSALGGIEWGTATDGDRIYVPIANLLGTPYQLQPSGASGNGGSWAALDPATGRPAQKGAGWRSPRALPEHAAAAQAPEALPDAVPGAELGRQRSPCNVVDREIVQGFEKLAVVPPLVPTPRAAGIEHLVHKHPIFFGHLRQYMADPPKSQPPMNHRKSGIWESLDLYFPISVHTA